MLKFKICYFLIIFFIFREIHSYAEQKISFFDLDFVVENSNIGKSILNELKI